MFGINNTSVFSSPKIVGGNSDLVSEASVNGPLRKQFSFGPTAVSTNTATSPEIEFAIFENKPILTTPPSAPKKQKQEAVVSLADEDPLSDEALAEFNFSSTQLILDDDMRKDFIQDINQLCNKYMYLYHKRKYETQEKEINTKRSKRKLSELF